MTSTASPFEIRKEEDLLQLMDKYFLRAGQGIILGRGDDCAVFSCFDDLCISSDIFLEEIHFKRDYFSAQDIGYKALAVNISDISAMGAKPIGFSLDLMIPQDLGVNFWPYFFQGMADLANTWDIFLLGGDISRARQLGVDITILGKSGGRYLKRKTAQAGEKIFLAGDLGLARTGLMVLEKSMSREDFIESVQAHLCPKVRIAAGQRLARLSQVTSLMDLSDGLAMDLPRLLPAGLGAGLYIEQDQIHKEVHTFCRKTGLDPLEQAFLGGEDYALLGTLRPDGVAEVEDKIEDFKLIGEVSKEKGIRINGQRVEVQGFDHLL